MLRSNQCTTKNKSKNEKLAPFTIKSSDFRHIKKIYSCKKSGKINSLLFIEL